MITHFNPVRCIGLTLGLSAFLAAATASHSATAARKRTMAAQMGHAVMATEASCFEEVYGSTKNTCPGGKWWIVPMKASDAISGTTLPVRTVIIKASLITDKVTFLFIHTS